MASTEADQPRVWFPNEIGPLKSVWFCAVLAIAFGLVCGFIAFIVWHLLPLPGGIHPWVATGMATFGMAAAFWANCNDVTIETGFVGVPNFRGKRLRVFPIGADKDTQPQETGPDGRLVSKPTNMYLISEGTTKLPPLFGAEAVDVRRDTSEEQEVKALSKDNLLMRGKVTFDREVVNPFVWLNAKNPDRSVFGIAAVAVENNFPCYCPPEFKDRKTHDAITCEIEKRIDQDDYKFGLNVAKVHLSELVPPDEVLAEYARIEIEVTQAKAEKTEWDAVRARVKEMVDEDKIDVHRAFEYFQAERGKAAAVRNTHRLEGLEPVVKVLGELLQALRR